MNGKIKKDNPAHNKMENWNSLYSVLPRKSNAAIFRLAIDGAQLSVDEIVFIDDEEIFVEVAKDPGIIGIHHTDYLSTSKALTDLELIIKQEKIENV